MDICCLCLSGGNLSSKNINLTEKMLDMFTINYSWLEKIPHLFQMVVYTFLRTIQVILPLRLKWKWSHVFDLLQDHVQPAFAALRQKEVNFVVKSLREHVSGLIRKFQIFLSKQIFLKIFFNKISKCQIILHQIIRFAHKSIFLVGHSLSDWKRLGSDADMS